MRSYAREVAFSKVYQYLISGETDNNFEQFDSDRLDDNDTTFIDTLVKITIHDTDALTQTIDKFARGFKSERIYKVDLAILIMAIAEIEKTDTPAPIVINEAVSIAKKYSTEKSVGFVNGILAEFLRSSK